MENRIDLSAFRNNAPISTVVLSTKDVHIRVFFSMNCCKKMFEHHEQGDDYRTAVVKAVFHMYEQTEPDKSNRLYRE